MKFLDEVELEVAAGKGGDGVISFRREKRVDKGGPDGGDGGRGGSIFFVGASGMNTLFSLKFNKIIRGQDGENGRHKDQYGHKGEDISIQVPLGTVVYEGDKVIADIVEEGKVLIAKGGRGGRGNIKFKTSRNPAPQLSEKGDKGEYKRLKLSLRVLADVGFVGKPSAGKSTLLSKISNAKPKIADYDFTTLTPQLGFVNTTDGSFVAADLPGLIKGAAEGKGLGHEFLKHIERCKVIAHIVDFGDSSKDPINDYTVINEELKSYSFKLEERVQVVVANKSDQEDFAHNLAKFKKQFPNVQVVEISALTEKNIERLKLILLSEVNKSPEIELEVHDDEITIQLPDEVIVNKVHEGLYEASGTKVIAIYNKIPLTSYDNSRRFNQKMRDIGLWAFLREKGVQEGDVVRIENYEFQWHEEEF